MANIAKVQLTDNINYQRNRINDIIDNLNTTTSTSIVTVNTEADLPSVASATSNVYLIKNHTIYKGAVLASIINSTYRMVPLKYDVNNANTHIYINTESVGTGVTLNRLVYLNSSGIWNLADSTDSDKQAIGIYGANNCVILEGIYRSASLYLTTGSIYYYNATGQLTLTPTTSIAGIALDQRTLRLMLGISNQQQADWSVSDTTSPSYIKNKPGVVTKTSNGFVPVLPNETTVTKFFRQDGTWSIPVTTTTARAGYCPALPADADANQKFLKGDGTWGTVPHIEIIEEESGTGTDGVIYGVIEEY